MKYDPTLVAIGDWSMVTAAVVFVAFVITYARVADWIHSRWGRAVMRLHGGIALVLLYGIVARWVPMPMNILLWARIISFAIVAGLGLQQLVMLIKIQRQGTKEAARHDQR